MYSSGLFPSSIDRLFSPLAFIPEINDGSNQLLNENVLRFVNLVGHVVHSNTEHFSGSPNKNIGDAFLLVWKVQSRSGRTLHVDLQPDASELFPDFHSTKDTSTAGTMADGALKAMAQTALDLHHINTLPAWELKEQLVSLNILPPDESGGKENEFSALTKSDDKVIDELIESLLLAGRDIKMGCELVAF